MRIRVSWAALAAVAAVTGCSVIRNARDAQQSVEPVGRGEVVRRDKLDLKGASLETLVAFALTNRPEMAAARLAVEDARLQLKTIAADAPLVSATPWTAPHLSANGSYSESSGGTRLGGGEGFRTSGSAGFGLSLEVLVWDFGRNDARAKAQAERVVSSEQSLVDEGYAVFDETATAYFNLVQARSVLEVAIGNRRDYAEQLERAEARLEAGEAQMLDVLRAKVDLASAAQEVVSASNEVETCGATLMRALGIEVARGTAKDVLDLSSVPLGTVYRAFPDTSYSVETAYDLSRTNSPEMRVARAKLRAAARDVDYAIADLMPSLSATTAFSWTDPMWYWSWGVSAAQSLFEGFRKTTAVDRAVVALKTAELDVETCEQKLSVSLATAVAVRDNAVEALLAAVASVRSAKENMALVTAQYGVGDASRIDLSTAVAQYSTAVGDCIKAFYHQQKAEASLYAIVGTLPVYREEKLEKAEMLK